MFGQDFANRLVHHNAPFKINMEALTGSSIKLNEE
jgi:hypothetical protein